MADLSDLLNQLNNLLTEDFSPDEFVENLERYSNDFELWYSVHRQNVEAGGLPEADELLLKHEELVVKAQLKLKEAGTALSQHRIKGKGIRAYTDSLPKRISFRRVKKG